MIRYEAALAADTLPRLVVEGAALTLKNARSLWEAGRGFLDGGEKIVDLTAVLEVDSAALAVLLEWQRENHALTGNGKTGALSIAGAPASLVTLAELYGLQEALGIIRCQRSGIRDQCRGACYALYHNRSW